MVAYGTPKNFNGCPDLQVVCLPGAHQRGEVHPFDAVSRDLPSERKAVLAPEIAKQPTNR